MLNIIEDLDEHFIFGGVFGVRTRVIVGAVVDNAVHVKIKIVELGNAVLSDELRDGGIALREPSKEFGDT